METALLTLLADPELEERLVDWLLAREGIPGFTSFPAHGHGTSQSRLSLAEQVAGRRARVAFQLVLPLASAQELVAALAADFRGAGIHHWLQPVLGSGPVGEEEG
jgi:hypothetical protein